jgi:3-phenylpropionate/trans-cinnamate dioxygenase ferredoxin reductase subunit
MRAMLLAMRDRGDARPVTLIYAASDPARVVFADELTALASTLRLDVAYVFEHPSPDWTADRGLVTVEILRRHVAPPVAAPHYFVCGPPAMMTDVERILRSLGVPESHVHGERFRMV